MGVTDPPVAEEENIELVNCTEEGPHPSGIQRSQSDAQKLKTHPKFVRFRSLENVVRSPEESKKDIKLISAEAHQIGRANWCGGWQNTILARRKKGLRPSNLEEELQEITTAMEQDERLMADNVDGEIQRRDALRELTKSLTIKRQIKRRLLSKRTSLQDSSDRVSWFNNLKYSLQMKTYKMKLTIHDALKDYSLWHKHIKTIEGIYGTSVGCYFRFLRYLFLFNLFIAVIIIGFCLVPQLIYNSHESYYDLLKPDVNETGTTSLYSDAGSVTTESSLIEDEDAAHFRGLDWLTGAGWFTNTELYYGGYITGSFSAPDSSTSYNMSHAYFFTIWVCFFLYLVTLLRRVSFLYKVNFIDVEEDFKITFIQKIFSAWDFNISDQEAADVKSRSIYNELIELIQEYQDEEQIDGFFQRLLRRTVQGVLWVILLFLFALLGWSLFLLLRDELHEGPGENADYWKEAMDMLVYPILATLIMVIIPIVLESIVIHEGYSKQRHELYATLTRIFLLELVVLGVVVFFWYVHSPGLKEELYFKNGNDSDSFSSYNDTTGCWETALGQEIYRLVLIDFLLILFSVLVFDTLKPVLVRRGNVRESFLTFNIARNTYHIIYNQTLLWGGLFFCPLLPLIISLKFFIIFYLQKMNVLRNLQPRDRPWRAAQTETLFYVLTLISFLLALFSFGFISVRGYSSPKCGPFQGYTHYTLSVWDESTEAYVSTAYMISFLLRPGVLLLILAVLCSLVYCGKNIAEGQREMVSVLRRQLDLEVGDRMFYIHLIEKVFKGEYAPGSPIGSGPITPPVFMDKNDPKHLTKRSSFVFTSHQKDNPSDSRRTSRTSETSNNVSNTQF